MWDNLKAHNWSKQSRHHEFTHKTECFLLTESFERHGLGRTGGPLWVLYVLQIWDVGLPTWAPRIRSRPRGTRWLFGGTDSCVFVRVQDANALVEEAIQNMRSMEKEWRRSERTCSRYEWAAYFFPFFTFAVAVVESLESLVLEGCPAVGTQRH